MVILAGAAARWGYLDVGGVVCAALAGSIAGDQLWYYVGRWWGCRLLARSRWWESRAEQVFTRLRRHDAWLILTFRFYYGLRSVTPFAIGAAKVPRLRYLLLNATGGVVWAIAFTAVGYCLGEAGGRLATAFSRYGVLLLLGVCIAGLLVWSVNLRRRRLPRNVSTLDIASGKRETSTAATEGGR